MNHNAYTSSSNEQLTDNMQYKYGLPDTSLAILKKIESDIDKGHGIHKGGFIDNEDVPRVRVGLGKRTAREMYAVDGIARLSFRPDGADPVIDYSDNLQGLGLSELTIEEARDAAFGGLTLGNSLDSSDTRMDLIVVDDMSPEPGRDVRQDNRGILEKTMFLANGRANPYVVESFSTYSKDEEGHAFGKLIGFTMVRRKATPAEVVAFYEVKRNQQ